MKDAPEHSSGSKLRACQIRIRRDLDLGAEETVVEAAIEDRG